jgi:cytochrome c biogenesis protein
VFSGDGLSLGQLVPGGEPLDVLGLPLRVVRVLPASGLLLTDAVVQILSRISDPQ